MLCVTTAFEILSGQGSALHIDPRQFYVQLYSALLTCEYRDMNIILKPITLRPQACAIKDAAIDLSVNLPGTEDTVIIQAVPPGGDLALH